MNSALITVWGLVFLVFLVIIGWRTYPVEPATIAAKDMPPLHLVQSGDLGNGTANGALVGRYLRRPVVKNQTLTPRDVSPAPILEADYPPMFAVFAPAASVRDGSLNAKTSGELCNDLEVIGKAAVIAPLCPPADDAAPCIALVRLLPTEDAGKVMAALAKTGMSDIRFKPACKPATK
jgi:hypothetical protein